MHWHSQQHTVATGDRHLAGVWTRVRRGVNKALGHRNAGEVGIVMQMQHSVHATAGHVRTHALAVGEHSVVINTVQIKRSKFTQGVEEGGCLSLLQSGRKRHASERRELIVVEEQGPGNTKGRHCTTTGLATAMALASSIDMYNNDVGKKSAQKIMKQTGDLNLRTS